MPEENSEYTRAERVFAGQVKARRINAGLSQQQLADEMVKAGVPYASQTTVSRIEKMTRPIRLIEAQALAVIFDASIWELTEDDDRVPALALLRTNGKAAARAISAFKRACSDLFEARFAAQQSLSMVDAMFPPGQPLPDEVREVVTREREYLEAQLSFDPSSEMKSREMGARMKTDPKGARAVYPGEDAPFLFTVAGLADDSDSDIPYN